MTALVLFVLVLLVVAGGCLYIGIAIGEGQAYQMNTQYLDRLSVNRQSEILVTALIVAAGGEIRCTRVNMALMGLRDTFSKDYDLLTGEEVYRHIPGVPCQP